MKFENKYGFLDRFFDEESFNDAMYQAYIVSLKLKYDFTSRITKLGNRKVDHYVSQKQGVKIRPFIFTQDYISRSQDTTFFWKTFFPFQKFFPLMRFDKINKLGKLTIKSTRLSL